MASTKENLKHEGINIGGDLKVYGDFIAPGAKKEVTFSGGRHYHGVPASCQEEDGEEEPADGDRWQPKYKEEEIVKELSNAFFGIEPKARMFLQSIKNMEPQEITRMVNDLVSKEVISPNWCKGDLWRILHAHGLYKRTKRTWNGQVIG